MASTARHDDVKLWLGHADAKPSNGSGWHTPRVPSYPDVLAEEKPAPPPTSSAPNVKITNHDDANDDRRDDANDVDSDASDDDDDDAYCAGARDVASIAARWVLHRADLIVGAVVGAVAVWLYESADADDSDNTWRWVMFASCVILGMFIARHVVKASIWTLDRVRRSTVRKTSDGGRTDERWRSVIYFLHATRRHSKHFLFVVGVTIAWATLIEPIPSIRDTVYSDVVRGLACACVVFAYRLGHKMLLKYLTSRLHSSTFWEQLHSTVRHESILKKLAGAPIRPRPRARMKPKASWTLVKGFAATKGRFGSSNKLSGMASIALAAKAALSPKRGHRRGGGHGGQGGKNGQDSPNWGSRDDSDGDGLGTSLNATAASTPREGARHQPRTLSAPRPPPPTFDGGGRGGAPPPHAHAHFADENPQPPPPASDARLGRHSPEPRDDQLGGQVPAPVPGPGSITDDDASSLSDGGYDAPISAAAAAAAVGSTEQAVDASKVSLSVINAAVRHVKRGRLSLPFRMTTRAVNSLHGRKGGSRGSKGRGLRGGASRSNVRPTSGAGGGVLGADSPTEREADEAARMMLTHLRRAGQPFVTPDAVGDFIEADQVKEAFDLIGGGESGVAALAESNIASALRKIYTERETFGKTLSDTSNLVKNVGVMIGFVIYSVAMFVSLAIYQVDIASLWLVISSVLVACAFVFGTTASTMFRTLVMIFVTNPFTVGDWIRLGDDTTAWRVRELGLNFFDVVNFWGEVIFVPASTVLESKVFNLSRSPPLWMRTLLTVDIGIHAADVDYIEKVMSTHIDSDVVNYTPGSFEIFCREIQDPLKVQLVMFYQLAFNASEFTKKLKANNRFLLVLQRALMDGPSFTFAGTDGQIFKAEALKSEEIDRPHRSDAGKSVLGGGGGGSGDGAARGSSLERVGESEIPTRAAAGSDAAGGEDESGNENVNDASRPLGIRKRHSRTARFRIPGRIRHYSGMLRDMKHEVHFDATEPASDGIDGKKTS